MPKQFNRYHLTTVVPADIYSAFTTERQHQGMNIAQMLRAILVERYRLPGDEKIKKNNGIRIVKQQDTVVEEAPLLSDDKFDMDF